SRSARPRKTVYCSPPSTKRFDMRTAEVVRNTRETRIRVRLNVDGKGEAKLSTGLPFLEHMLEQVARHAALDLDIEAQVTLHIDNLRGDNAHHQCETMFKAFARALRMAAEPDPRAAGSVPSTKGSL